MSPDKLPASVLMLPPPEMVDPKSVFTILEIDNWADDPAGWAAENTDATP